ncbi:MAG TPA: amylo-alpha-1,6-glucosidase [Thermoanaerobaculia bacterium]|nr:amylo-alpha-1,6-glucosidase [Thermoanaerobaculia bacterium]
MIVGWQRGDPHEALLKREWLVTNGLGGYASGTLAGACTRRFHGLLIAAMPAPLGRVMMVNHFEEQLVTRERTWRLSAEEKTNTLLPDPGFLEEFVLEKGLPVWRWSAGGIRFEKRVVMPHLQNTTYIVYRLLEAPEPVTLELRVSLHFRPHEGLLNEPVSEHWTVTEHDHGIELTDYRNYPPLRLQFLGHGELHKDEQTFPGIIYRIEKARGYEFEGTLWSPGTIRFTIEPGHNAGLIASVESWDTLNAMDAGDACMAEHARRDRLLSIAKNAAADEFSAQLVLAADQFLISPRTRSADEARAYAAGDDPRTVIAGYHWFTDWGRDTMISLEGLTLATGRHREAGNILRTFATYIRDGLIPNLFPEGEHGGLYHTADATMWFFHAVLRYIRYTNDRATLRALLPKMIDIIDHHLRGTRFGIHVDANDGLLSQGAEGYQLTWMDAKVGDWVVTPRRGKAVEINALWYNALCILADFLREEGDANSERMHDYATRVRESFNQRFWYEEGQYLYDVLDMNDPALRPNQIFAISLDHPVLDESKWARIVGIVQEKLLTPYGLRSLSQDHPDYKKAYDGDLRARDAAYHQGTVWGWLIGPFIDAWRKVHPDGDASQFLQAFPEHMEHACIGTIAEVFDAEAPYQPRGCAAQAWSVAEVLRTLVSLRNARVAPERSGVDHAADRDEQRRVLA